MGFRLVKTFGVGLMSSSIDKALMAMTLEEEDAPFQMPDLLEFCSSEKNELSLVGRVLNPDGQKMANLIMNLSEFWFGLMSRNHCEDLRCYLLSILERLRSSMILKEFKKGVSSAKD